MIWFTWRQYRWEAVAGLALLVAFGGVVLLLTVDGSGLLAQLARSCTSGSDAACDEFGTLYSNSHLQVGWQCVYVACVAIPALVGVFVGAPMVAREVENGTHLLAWSQGVTRRRWFLSRVGLVGVGVVVGVAALAAVAQGWFGTLVNESQWNGFEVGLPVVIAYALFALALGVAAGAAIRRTVPAMAATLIGFIGVRVVVAVLARPRYLAPLIVRAGIIDHSSGGGLGPNAWWFGDQAYADASGHSVSLSMVNQLLAQCTYPVDKGVPIPVGKSVPICPSAANGIFQLTSYQPGARFWLFQGIEAAIFVLLALGLFVLAHRLVMRIR
jgi:ABC-type transport system involved in multi-copper enzyme maturation permease subunit